MSDINVVLSKVKKLFALSQSPNESEAAVALAKAHAMLKEYNLSMSDISPDSKYGIKENIIFTAINESKWKTTIILGVAKANYCEAVKRLYQKGYAMTLVGKEHNIVVAKEMVCYLTDTIERLSKKLPVKERLSYKEGASYKLYTRLLDTLKQETSECTALVVQEQSMIDDFLNGKVETKEMTIVSKNRKAYYEGVKDANDISLNSQISNSNSKNLSLGE